VALVDCGAIDWQALSSKERIVKNRKVFFVISSSCRMFSDLVVMF
jgi:hypothetical protein